MLYHSGAKKTKIQQINEAKKKRTGKSQEEGRRETVVLKPNETPSDVNIDGLVEEFRLMVAKLLAPHRERIENIPAPA